MTLKLGQHIQELRSKHKPTCTPTEADNSELRLKNLSTRIDKTAIRPTYSKTKDDTLAYKYPNRGRQIRTYADKLKKKLVGLSLSTYWSQV